MPRPKKEKPNRADGRYEVKITIGKKIDGTPIRKSFYSEISKEDAKRQAEEWKVNKKAREMSGLSNITADYTFAEWADIWLKKYKLGRVKENTYLETYYRTVHSYLIPCFGQYKLTAIKPADVQCFISEQAKKYSETTLHKMCLCLHSIFDTAIDNDICFKNPAKNINSRSTIDSVAKKTYSQAEVDDILAFSNTHKYGLYIRILLELGLRCSELLALKWGDFNLDNKTVHIQRACVEINHTAVISDPKSKTSVRTLPITDNLCKLIESQKRDPDEFVVTPIIYASNFTKNKYNTFFKDYLNYNPAGRKLNPHMLRHTCGTLLYSKTKDIYAVSRFLGHANVNITTKYYVTPDVEVLRNKLEIK